MVTLIENRPRPHEGLTRRQTLAWVASAVPVIAAAGCGGADRPAGAADSVTEWARVGMPQRTGPGYGPDPDMLSPRVPWRLVMNEAQRRQAAAMADVIVPASGEHPSASGAGVDAFLDEWISAPYPRFEADRAQVLAGLAWSEREARRRFGRGIAQLSGEEVAGFYDLLNEAANAPRQAPEVMREQGAFFGTLRALVVGGYYTSEAGIASLGYVGNVAIGGDWPGPSREALDHLSGALASLGLSMPRTD